MADTYEHGYEDGRLDGLIYAYEVAGRSDLANLVRIKRKQMQDGWTPADDWTDRELREEQQAMQSYVDHWEDGAIE